MRLSINLILLVLTSFIFQSCRKTGVAPVSGTQLTEWNKSSYNAFTDLIKFNDNYFCVYREAATHDSYNGKLRVIRSFDGATWTDFSLLSVEGKDLRDPHFFVDNNNVLSVGASGRNTHEVHENIVFKLQNGNFFQSPADSVDNNFWLWSFSKLNNTVYSIGYNLNQPCFNSLGSNKPKISLFGNINAECTNYACVSTSDWIDKNFKCPCESSMVFTDDSTLVAIVRDEHTPGQSHIGISKKPFKQWQWQTFHYFIRGPKLALLPDGKIFLAAASMVEYDKTYYAIINLQDFSVEKIRAFPSGGDTGYPGVVIEGSTALVSYYSSHEGNARVYIYRINY